MTSEMTSETSSDESRTVVGTIVIGASAARVWQALTDPDQTEQWYFSSRVRSTWEPGSPIEYVGPDGSVLITGEVIEVVPEQRMVHTFDARWSPEVAGDGPSRFELRLEPMGEAMTRVTIEHSELPARTATAEQVEDGWSLLLSAVKTLIETGTPLPIG